MTAFTRTRPGPPENGRYQVGDTVTDSNNVVWTCTKGGMAGYLGDAQFAGAVASSVNVQFGAASIATVTAAESFSAGIHKTVLTLADAPVNVADVSQFGGTKIYDFPEGQILVLGVIGSVAPKTTTAIASTINSGVAGAASLGSVTASNISLTSTMANFAPSTAIVTSTTINVAAAAVNFKLAAPFTIDGSATAVDLYLNTSITTATDIDADGTIAYGGTVTIHWINLGDV